MKHQVRIGVNTPEVEIKEVAIPPADKPRDWRWYMFEMQARDALDAEIENALRDWVAADTRRADASKWVRDAKKAGDERRVALDKGLPEADRPKGGSAAERETKLEAQFREDPAYALTLSNLIDAQEELVEADHVLAKAEFILKELRKSEASKDTRLRFLMSIGKIPMRHVPDEQLEEIGFDAQKAKAEDVQTKDATDAWVERAVQVEWESPEAAKYLEALPEGVDPEDQRVKDLLAAIKVFQGTGAEEIVL